VKRIFIFTLIWLIINLLQSFFTGIIDDEAYYWVYSRFPDWGYYDHPPMIALLIKAGYALFSNEFGVRFINTLMGAGTIFILLYMLRDEVADRFWMMLLAVSLPLMHLHVAGFIATPDIPLVFFSTIFFFLYRKYLEDDSPGTVALLSVTCALMLYSKYHALLVIGFTVLSNLKLLQRRSFWLIVLLALILYLPHILWQIRHDFVSFGYHLVYRSTPFRVRNILEYIGSQILVLGPVTGMILLYLGICSAPGDRFRAALKFNFIGFLLFFLLSSVKGHVEPHWTAAAFVPLLLYTVPLVPRSGLLQKSLQVFVYITIIIILFIRILFILAPDLFPEKAARRFLNKKECMRQLRQLAGERPVVFTNSYQNASLYWFYTGTPAFSQNNKHYRMNQFDLLDMEAELMGREVLFIPTVGFPGCDTLNTPCGEFYVHITDCFCHYNRVKVIPPDRTWRFEAGEKVQVPLELNNPTDEPVVFREDCTHAPLLVYSFFGKKDYHRAYFDRKAKPLPDIPPHASVIYPIQVNVPDTPGEYRLMFSFGSRYLPAGINGKPVRLTVSSTSIKNSGKN
jgi:hypothetical protein